jgi:broad specificity phosphatase PhoE
VTARARSFLARLAARGDGGPVVVVTHGEVARILLGLLRGYPEDSLPWTSLANGEVVTVTGGARRGPPRRWESTGHDG